MFNSFGFKLQAQFQFKKEFLINNYNKAVD